MKYKDYIETLTKATIILAPSYWEGLSEDTGVDDAHIMALIRQAGAYFANAYETAGAAALAAMCGAEDFSYWGTGDTYLTNRVKWLVVKIARIFPDSDEGKVGLLEGTTSTNIDERYLLALEVLKDLGLEMDDFWSDLPNKIIVPTENVDTLLKTCGSYACGYSYKYAVPAIMQCCTDLDQELLMSGTYGFEDLKHLCNSMALSIFASDFITSAISE